MILRDILRHLAASLILLAVVVAIAMTRADVDLWGHVLFGLDTLRDLRLESADPYSFTSDRPWVNHEWLSEVILALAWRSGGSVGLVAVKLACALGALALVSVSLRARGVALQDQIPLLGLAVAGMLPRVNHIRPQLFSVLLYAGLLLAFTKSERGRRSALLWCLPILTLWANLHGGWIVGLGTVGLWTGGLAIEQRHQGIRAWSVLAFAAAAALATLINPYGFGLWRFPPGNRAASAGRRLRSGGRSGRIRTSSCSGASLPRWWPSPCGRAQFPLVSARALVSIAWCIASVRVSRLDTFFALSVIVLIGPSVIRFFSSARSAAVRRSDRAS